MNGTIFDNLCWDFGDDDAISAGAVWVPVAHDDVTEFDVQVAVYNSETVKGGDTHVPRRVV